MPSKVTIRLVGLELSGCLTSVKVKAHARIGGTVAGKRVQIGRRAMGHPRVGVSARESRIFCRKRAITCTRCRCCVLGGPTKIISTARSGGSDAMLSLVSRGREGSLFPIKELSGSARKLLLVAGSNRLTRRLLSPGGRMSGICFTGVSKGIARRSIKEFTRKLRVKRRGPALPTRLRVLGDRRVSRVQLAVERKGFRRIGQVFRTIKGRIVCLGHLRVKDLMLSPQLTLKRCQGLAKRRLRTLHSYSLLHWAKEGRREGFFAGCREESREREVKSNEFYLYVEEYLYQSSVF